MATTLLFTYDSGVPSFLRTHCVVGDALRQKGEQVLLYACPGGLNFCPMMGVYQLSASSSPDVRQHLCRQCQLNVLEAANHYGFPIVYGSALPLERIGKMLTTILKQVPQHPVDFMFEGMAVGKAACFDFTIDTKCSDLYNLSDEMRSLYMGFIRDVLFQYYICDLLITQHSIDRLTTFDVYSSAIGAHFAAHRRGKKAYALCHEALLDDGERRLMCIQGSLISAVPDLLHRWNKVRNYPITEKQLSISIQSVANRFQGKGTHMYSPKACEIPEALEQRLGLSRAKKTIVAFTSSLDERLAMELSAAAMNELLNITDVFQDQINWLCALRNWASTRDDAQVVVRVHPREGSWKKNNCSDHLKKMQAAFSEPVPNFQVIWPDDDVSSYTLGELADLVTVAWTTLGRELARLGAPLLVSTRGYLYPEDDCAESAATPDEWLAKLDKMLACPVDGNLLLRSLRMDVWLSTGATRYLHQYGLQSAMAGGCYPHTGESSAADIQAIVDGTCTAAEANMRDMRDGFSSVNVSIEMSAVRRHLGGFLKTLIAGMQSKDGTLGNYSFVSAPLTRDLLESTAQTQDLAVFGAQGHKAILFFNGRSYARYSRLAARLIRILASMN